MHFADDEVPNVTGQLVDSREAADALRVPTVGEGRTGLCVEALRRAKRLITDRPVLAGVIGPFSLVGRLCDVTEIMYLCYDEPEMVQVLLDKATDFLVQYALAFRDAGVDGVMMAEPLAGLLSPDLNAEFSTPWVQRIVQAVQRDDFAVIYHNRAMPSTACCPPSSSAPRRITLATRSACAKSWMLRPVGAVRATLTRLVILLAARLRASPRRPGP